MIFSLGFLVASLCALLLLPAVNGRATRLARRKMAALFPLTNLEIAAEKDYLRAQFAIEHRRLERRMEAVGAMRHVDRVTIGTRTREAVELARTVESREATLMAKETEMTALRHERDGIVRDLEGSRAEFAVGLATLQVLEEAHREILDDLLRTRHRHGEAADAPGQVAGRSALAPPQPAGSRPDMDMEAEIARLRTECDALRTSLASAEQRAARPGDDAALRASIAALADSLMRGERLPSVAGFPLQKQS